MVAAYTYGPFAVVDPSTSHLVQNSTGGKLVLVKDGPAQPIYDANGTLINTLSTNDYGQPAVFRADIPFGLVQFGTIVQTVQSNEVFQFAIDAQNAIDIANSAQATAQQALDAANAGSGTGTGGGLPSGTTLEQIPNGSTRLALTQAERDRIAGLPTTFLQLGTTATTAKAGNYVPPTPTPAVIGAVANGRNAGSMWVFTAAEGLPSPSQATALGIPVGAVVALLSA